MKAEPGPSLPLSHLPTHLAELLGRLKMWRRRWHPAPVLLPGKSHGRRSLVGYSPWGRKEWDMTERLPFLFFSLKRGLVESD